MKKALPNTKVTVKLRRSNYKEEWYLIIESSPVYKRGSKRASRVWSKVYRLLRHTFFVRKKKKMCIWIHFRVEFII